MIQALLLCRHQRSCGQSFLHSHLQQLLVQGYWKACILCALLWRLGATTCAWRLAAPLFWLIVVVCCCSYENLVQIRCLLEDIPPYDILSSWHTILPEYMDKWQLSRTDVRVVPL